MKKFYHYYFASGKVVVTKSVLSIIDLAEFEAKFGTCIFSEIA